MKTVLLHWCFNKWRRAVWTWYIQTMRLPDSRNCFQFERRVAKRHNEQGENVPLPAIFINSPHNSVKDCMKLTGLYPPITYYWTVPLILDHTYLVGKLTSSKIADTKVSGF
jgi:hypothetical protein